MKNNKQYNKYIDYSNNKTPLHIATLNSDYYNVELLLNLQ